MVEDPRHSSRFTLTPGQPTAGRRKCSEPTNKAGNKPTANSSRADTRGPRKQQTRQQRPAACLGRVPGKDGWTTKNSNGKINMAFNGITSEYKLSEELGPSEYVAGCGAPAT